MINRENKGFSEQLISPPYSSTQWLEGVKALAILWIAWYHIDQLILPPNQQLFSIRTLAHFGFSGVNVFLLLSGFGLAFSMSCTQLKSSVTWEKLPWRKFFIRRLLRIYPLYIFAHILFFLLGAAIGKYADMPLDIGFLLSITGLRVFFPHYFWYGPDAFWFIGLIIQFYLIFPVLFWLLSKTGQLKFLFITLSFCALARLVTSSGENAYVFTLGLAPNRMAEFCLGMAVGYGTAINQGLHLSFLNLKNRWFGLLSGISIIVAWSLYWHVSSPVRTVTLDLLIAIAAFTVLTILVLLIVKIYTIYKLLTLIGSISYCFYLIHSPPIRPAFAVFKNLGITNTFCQIILYLGIFVGLAIVISKLENHILSMKRRKATSG